MRLNSDTEETPLVQAEPPQWHVYRALVMYRDSHADECDNLYYANKLRFAHDAYLNTFAAG